MASGRFTVGHEGVTHMSDEEKKPNNNIIRYAAIAVITVIITLALCLLVWTYLGGNIPLFGNSQASIRIDASDETVYLYHEGGDSLDMNKLRVSIAGCDIASEQITLLSSAGLQFIPGDIIGVETVGQERPSTLILWYDDVQGGRELAGIELPPLSILTVTQTPIPVETEIPIPVETEIVVPVETEVVVPVVTPVEIDEQDPNTISTSEAGIVQIWPLEPEITPIQTLEPPESTITFEVSTNSGEQPLAVQFKDTTEDCVVSRLWEFGDGGKSSDRFTTHTYVYPGTYMATLSVTFCNGSESPAAFQQIHVNPISREDSYVTGFKNATILPGGTLHFIVTNDVDIRVGGKLYTLYKNDAIQIEQTSGGQGIITVIGNVIIDLTLPDSIIYVNGEEIAKGRITRLNGITFSNLAVSDLSLYISPGHTTDINGMVNGYNVISPNMDYGYFINNIGLDSTGKMIIDAKEQRFVLQAGIKGITQTNA